MSNNSAYKFFYNIIYYSINSPNLSEYCSCNFCIKTKSPDLSVRALYLFPLSSSGGFDLSVSTHCLANSFVCNFLLSSVGFNPRRCFLRLTLVFHSSLLTFSGPSIPLLSQLPFRFLTPSVLTSFRPSQFWVLTTKPLFFFSLPSRFRLTAASPVPVLALAFLGFPFLSGLISHALLPGSCTQLYCSFPFTLPCFAPTAVPQVLTFFSAFSRPLLFRSFPLPACFLSSARLPLPATQPSALPFLFFPVLPCSCFPGAPSPLSLPRLPLSLRPGFPCLPSRFLYSALLLVSFRPSLIRSRSCSSGAYLMLSLSVYPLLFRFLSSASFPVPATQPLFLPFLFLPASVSQ